ncbi:MAG TPA: DUF1648 domain-containing protein [Dehalococcoidales bacterium]|nr:DUF1648 domain-containing protein [Dehalococcoidales bacterium]
MKNRIVHPLWTHLPILGLIVYLVINMITASPLPDRVPVNFDLSGQPAGYGSPWAVFSLVLGLVLLYGIISLVIDEAWARSEKRKTFNWLSPFDEIIAGVLVGIHTGYLRMLSSGLDTFSFPWVDVLVTGGIAVGLAIILEFLRPFRPNPQAVTIEDTSNLEKELKLRLKENRPILYWQSQEPLWVKLVTIAMPLVMLAVAAVMWFSQPWFSLLYIAIAVASSLLYGGLKTIVTRDKITVKLGLLGLRVLNLKTSEIISAEIMEFSPIKDFGGYGIRYNGKIWAYYFKGNRGVKITLNRKTQYLIGTNRPEQLLTVIKAVSGIGP